MQEHCILIFVLMSSRRIDTAASLAMTMTTAAVTGAL